MAALHYVIAALWVIFIAYWIVSAAKSKRAVESPSQRKGALIRIVAMVAIIVLFQTRAFQRLALRYDSAPHELLAVLGVALCALGLGFAVWARVHLGRNWGMPMSVQKDAELVTTGPYKLVRHPIYAGMLLALLGSSMVEGLWWLVFFVFFAIYFIAVGAREEEKLMMRQFPDEYPEYRRRTKRLIPFIL